MALTVPDLEELAKIKPLTDKEIAMVSSFNAAESWGKGARNGDASSAPPGAVKILFNVEGRPGVPVKMIQTPTQKGFHSTDERFRAQWRNDDARRVVV